MFRFTQYQITVNREPGTVNCEPRTLETSPFTVHRSRFTADYWKVAA